ncbi:MAG: hypothetical protein Q4C25_06745 [Bacillota bacterium]|nr:hypothetical protein [Bacillota bacterium]
MRKTSIAKILIVAVISCGLVFLSLLYPVGTSEGYFYDDGKWPCVEVAFDSVNGAENVKDHDPAVFLSDPQSGEDETLEIDSIEWDGQYAYIYVVLPEGSSGFADYGFEFGDAACKVIWDGGETECTYWE